ncbi:3,4-dihydroxy-2-butanone-4-phosphate synthase [Candidatus Berkiella aquae]|uniref:3,4-dihydroxy-2-butanone 4-phosphate synthase n=1 Tax=Candidatus Berkiella aquae TaxID=295108 RepID=A0A0Q9YMI7_9GAMM|nr:3,4-dihydroxy-2-butanone-4-phosphate synthase [Candidatus Berkiella aquae]MCS5710332.1 3,4-dihydroxy-2-butanone-4-phosphate synthase [Candidatus Berkiella aquae]
MTIHSTEEIIEDIRQGKMVIMIDDEDRENEGDIIMAAQMVTDKHITFMAREACGLICLPMSKECCEQIGLARIRGTNHSKIAPNFTLSIEAAQGVTTGISAKERAHTILTAVHPKAKPEDVVQPGHIFPIMALPGGVLERPGHTEASVDLAHLAGLAPAGVLCEILNEDGTMARLPELKVFAQKHGLKLGTIADLVAYRQRLEAVEEASSLTDFISA